MYKLFYLIKLLCLIKHLSKQVTISMKTGISKKCDTTYVITVRSREFTWGLIGQKVLAGKNGEKYKKCYTCSVTMT